MIKTAELQKYITSLDRLMKYSSLPSEPQPESKSSFAIFNSPKTKVIYQV